MNAIIESIKMCFAQSYNNVVAKYNNTYDPFKGHDKPTPGKSYFVDVYKDVWFVPSVVKQTDEITIIATGHVIIPDPTGQSPTESPRLLAGYHVVTEPKTADAPLKIKTNHNELQFFGRAKDWKQTYTPTDEITVIQQKEDDVWLLATAFPGPAGVHNDQKVLEKLAKATNLTAELAKAFDCNLNNVILKSDEDYEEL